jgi:hypothetical protein
MTKSKRTIARKGSSFAVLHSDPHFGYRFGYMKPGTVLEAFDEADGDLEPELTATQRVLAKWNDEDFENVNALVDGRPSVYIVEGDVCHGTWVGETVSPRLADQPDMAVQGLTRWVQRKGVAKVRFVKGTAVHSHKHGSLELLTARLLRATTGKDVRAYYHMVLPFDGVSFDLAHKGPPPGKRQWLDANELRLYVRNIMMRSLINGYRPPHVIVRGHFHERRFAHVHEHLDDRVVDSWGVIMPAYSIFKDDWTNHATQAKSHMNAGTVVVEIRDRKVLNIHDFTHTYDLRRHEKEVTT